MKQESKRLIINEISDLIQSGKTYSEVLVLNGPKWSLPISTFKRYWKEAKSIPGKPIQETPIRSEEPEIDILTILRSMNFCNRDLKKHYDEKLKGYSGNVCFTEEAITKIKEEFFRGVRVNEERKEGQ